MDIKPLSDRVVVKPMKAEGLTPSGLIHLPESSQEKPHKGEVLAVGPGKVLENGTRVEPSVKKGDVVLYGKYSGNEIFVNREEILILKEEEILAVF